MVKNVHCQKIHNQKKKPLLTFDSFRFSGFQVLAPIKTKVPCYIKMLLTEYLFIHDDRAIYQSLNCVLFTLSKHGHPLYTPVSMVN